MDSYLLVLKLWNKKSGILQPFDLRIIDFSAIS